MTPEDESNESSSHTQDHVEVGDWEIDLDSETLYWSAEVYRIRGLPLEYTPTFEEGIRFYHPEDRPILRSAVEKLRTEGETYDLELREISDTGEIYWVRTVGVPQYDETGKITAIRGVYRDITARKEREKQLDETRRKLEQSNQQLNEFASIVSHDLRNPLNVAEGRLQLAIEECDSDHLAVVARAHQRMGTLIADLLALAREGNVVEQTELVRLAEIIETAWDGVDTKEATLAIETTRTIRADPSRLQQLLENLIRNSVEHGSTDSRSVADDSIEHGSTDNRPAVDDAIKHGRRAVSVSIGDCDDGFYVSDNGPGIPETEHETVFESGYSTTRDGTGLGLSIVEQIATAHGWTITVTNGPDSGARFELTGVEIV